MSGSRCSGGGGVDFSAAAREKGCESHARKSIEALCSQTGVGKRKGSVIVIFLLGGWRERSGSEESSSAWPVSMLLYRPDGFYGFGGLAVGCEDADDDASADGV